ncbi:MAG TPA: DUF2807 domain-containing protein [Rhizomicrobium sp.]|nr:DUF2807 domain-containing protein [Rhizomicrobium sp.]
MKAVCSLPFSAALVSAFLAVAPASAQQLVRVSPFDSLELEGGGHVIVKSGDVQTVRLIQGSLAYTRFVQDEPGKLRIEACKNDCPNHYDLEVEITTPHIEGLGVSGGGAIDSKGDFPRLRHLALGIEGGGTIDARTIGATKVEAAVNGGGVIKVRADDALTAAVNGGGEIRYWGNPRITQAIEGGGQIERGE